MSSNHRLGLSTLHFLLKELRTEVSLGKRRKCCPSTLLQRNLNWNATIPNYFQLDLCLRKTRAGKSHDTQAALAIVSKKSVFKMFFFHTKTRQRSSNSADLKSVLEKATFPWREWNFRASQRMRGLSSFKLLFFCLLSCSCPPSSADTYKPWRRKQKYFNCRMCIPQQFCLELLSDKPC